MIIALFILLIVSLTLFVTGLVFATIDYSDFKISLHLLTLSLLCFVVTIICLLVRKKSILHCHSRPSVAKICNNGNDSASINQIDVERSGLWESKTVGQQEPHPVDRQRRHEPLHNVNSVPIVRKLGHQDRHTSSAKRPNSCRRIRAKTLPQSLLCKFAVESPCFNLSRTLTKDAFTAVVNETTTGSFDILPDLISLHSQASLLSGEMFPFHERLAPGPASPEIDISTNHHCSRIEAVDLRKFFRSNTCQQIDVKENCRTPAPQLKFITRLTHSSASLDLRGVPGHDQREELPKSFSTAPSKTLRNPVIDRCQHRILVKYIPVRTEWISKSVVQSPTSKCQLIRSFSYGKHRAR